MGIESIIGSVAGPLIGGLLGGSESGSGTGQTQTQSKEPWAEAAPWLKKQIEQGQLLQDHYTQNPFNSQQQTGYQNTFSDLNNFRSNIAPGLMQFANNAMTGQGYQRQQLAQPGQVGYGPRPMQQMQQPQAPAQGGLMQAGGQGPFGVAQGGLMGAGQYAPVDFASMAAPPPPPPQAPAQPQWTDADLQAAFNRMQNENANRWTNGDRN